jgi:hypothetical protein
MLSLFNCAVGAKVVNNVHITIFKPNHGSQLTLIKGKLGQFKLTLSDCLSSRGTRRMLLPYGGASLDHFADFKQKRLVYNEKTKRLDDVCYADFATSPGHFWPRSYKVAPNNQRGLKRIYVCVSHAHPRTPSAAPLRGTAHANVLPGASHSDAPGKLSISAGLALRGRPADASICRQVKNMMTGVSQGFTMNLELRGIGYQAGLRSTHISPSPEKTSMALTLAPRALKSSGSRSLSE